MSHTYGGKLPVHRIELEGFHPDGKEHQKLVLESCAVGGSAIKIQINGEAAVFLDSALLLKAVHTLHSEPFPHRDRIIPTKEIDWEPILAEARKQQGTK